MIYKILKDTTKKNQHKIKTKYKKLFVRNYSLRIVLFDALSLKITNIL